MTDYNDGSRWFIVNGKNAVKNTKKELEKSHQFDKSRKIVQQNGVFYLPIGVSSVPVDTLAEKLGQSRYSIYPPMVLFNNKVSWTLEECQQLIHDSVRYFGRADISHLALNAPLHKNDERRSPTQLTPLYGDFKQEAGFNEAFWCSCTQNGIKQIWAPLHTMFSRGNIHEKSRVLTFDNVHNHDIIDLYCGIGYFTFSYARGQARRIFAWDINPWSIEGLMRGAKSNKFPVQRVESDEPLDSSVQIYAFLQDNAHSYERLAGLDNLRITHINMGLLPHCKKAWSLAMRLATLENNQFRSVVLHIHENVADDYIDKWRTETRIALEKLSDSAVSVTDEHVEKIKTFAPGVWHVCGDFVVER